MELFEKPPGVETRWVSFENPSGARGSGGVENKGAKGHPFDHVRAGETKTLLDIHAKGTIRRIWMTINDRSPEMLRSLRLDIYWEDAKRPAVSAPLGDFFGVGLGKRVAFESALFSDPEGRSFNCFIPMPFRFAARVTVTNESDKDLPLLFYDIDLTLGDQHDSHAMYFHTHWRRESPNVLGKDFMILPRVSGIGRFLGCNVGVITDARYEGSWWGEGEVKVLIGDDQFPTLCGTGTEDYIGTGWGQGLYSHRTQGCLVGEKETGFWAFYRYHIDDPVYFLGGCQVSMQTIGGSGIEKVIEFQQAGLPVVPVTIDPGTTGSLVRLMDLPQPVDLENPDLPRGWCNFWRQDDWSATAYFYLNSHEGSFPKIAHAADRIAGLIPEEPT